LDVEGHIEYMFHPPTYLNKLLVAKADSLELWNIKSDTKIHTFANIKVEGRVSFIAESPLVDIVAIGSSRGEILVVNLRADEVLISLS